MGKSLLSGFPRHRLCDEDLCASSEAGDAGGVRVRVSPQDAQGAGAGGRRAHIE